MAITFAGTERDLAEELATLARDAGLRVFYDDFYPEQLWGKNLPEFFDDIYRKRSRYCLMLMSPEYAERMWTTHERRSAQARALQEKGNEYILPIEVVKTDLPGMPPTVGYHLWPGTHRSRSSGSWSRRSRADRRSRRSRRRASPVTIRRSAACGRGARTTVNG